MRKQSIFIIVTIAIALGLGFWRETMSASGIRSGGAKSTLQVGTQLPLPQTIPAFALKNMDEQLFTEADLKQHWSLMVFGYTRCPASCPIILQTLSDVQKTLQPKVQVDTVFVSIEPEYDTPTQLKAFFAQDKYQNMRLKALTGAYTHVSHLAQTVGIHLAEATHDDSHKEHSGTLLLVNPEGKIAAVFSYQDKPGLIAQDVKHLMYRYNRV